MIGITYMKHFLIKFNHGVEIGATLAHIGHYFRTKDDQVWNIMIEEMSHGRTLKCILKELEDKLSKFIDNCFKIIGNTIKILCRVCPIWSLNFIARSMEFFAVFNYGKLAKLYPDYAHTFISMATAEERHGNYFARKK